MKPTQLPPVLLVVITAIDGATFTFSKPDYWKPAGFHPEPLSVNIDPTKPHDTIEL